MPIAQALAVIRQGRGRHFCPATVDALCAIV